MASLNRIDQRSCSIPASPNWYCSGVASCNDSGYYAFAARNSVYLINLQESPHTCRDIIHLKRDRVTSVCLLPVERDDRVIVACGSEERCVKVWDEKMKQIIAEHKKHQAKVNVIVTHEAKNITSGDDKGLIITWHYETDNLSSWMPIQASLMSMAASPHNQWLTAVGYANGHVLVCNVKKQEIFQHFKSHLDEVHAVVWCPSSQFRLSRSKQDSESEGYLLASGSKDKTIKIWNSTQENSLLSLTLPARTTAQKGRKKFDDLNRAKIWIALCWCKGDTLISSSLSGEMLVWDLKTKDWSCIAPAHNRMIFTISFDFKSGLLISSSMDRQIMFWKADTYEHVNSIPSLGGFVYSLSASTLDPHCIIYGVGDNLIRFWNTRSAERPYDTNFLWQGIKSKVTVVTCHKTKESVIGFATDDGHVGVYNIISGKFEVSASYHKKTVYSLSWGPSCDTRESGEGNWLFSCGGEGSVLIHSMHNLQGKARDMNAIIKRTNSINAKEKLPSRSDLEWKPDLTTVAVGNDDGSIELFTAPNLKRICVIQVHKKIINCLEWHHEFDFLQNETGSKYSTWLASGSSDNYVCVTDLTHVLDSDNSEDKLIVIKEKFRYYSCHSQRITNLSWNPHTAGILASSSFDGTVQIWNVILNEPIANFRNHVGKVLCVLWSFVDQDVVYSGGEDFTLRRWAISDCQHKTPPGKKSASSLQKSSKTIKTEIAANQNSKVNASLEEVHQVNSSEGYTKDGVFMPVNKVSSSEASLSGQGIHSASPIDESREQAFECINQNVATEVASPNELEASNQETTYKKNKPKDSKKKKPKSLFPLFSTFNHKQKAASQHECVMLAQRLKDPSVLRENSEKFVPGKGDHVNLGLFADKLSAFKMFNEEGNNHEKLGNMDQQLHLELWKGNIGGALGVCQKKGELNEMMVAMSPLGGFDLWQSTMAAYADQLAANADFYAAATYYLAASKVQETIDMFKKQNMYKEAIAVAKVRLPSSDTILLDLYRVWGDKLGSEGCFEHAAKCYLASGCHKDAIAILSKKGDISSLKTAAQVASICGEKEMAQVLATETIDFFLVEMRFSELSESLNQIENHQELSLISIIHECFLSGLQSTDADVKLEISSNLVENGWMNSRAVSKPTIMKLKGIGFTMPEECTWNIVEVVCCLYYEKFKDIPKIDVLKNSPPCVPKQCQFKTSNNNANLKKMLLQVSYQLMYGLPYLLQGNFKECFKHWLHAIELCYTTYQYDLVERIYAMLFPRDYTTVEEFMLSYSNSAKTEDRDYLDSCFKSFSGFYYSATMYRFWWKKFPILMARGCEDQTPEVILDCKANGIRCEDSSNVSLLQEYTQRLLTLVEAKFPHQSMNSEQLLRLLSCFAAVTISDFHARVSELKKRISEIGQKLMETKIRKQLRQHMKQRSDESKKKEKVKVKKDNHTTASSSISASNSSARDQNWRARESASVTKVSHDTESTSGGVQADKQKKSDNDRLISGEIEILGHDLDVIDDRAVVLLTEENFLLKEELDLIPDEFKDCPFPDSAENAKILVFICLRWIEASFADDTQTAKLKSLVNDLITWGNNCCLADVDLEHFQEQHRKLNKILKEKESLQVG